MRSDIRRAEVRLVPNEGQSMTKELRAAALMVWGIFVMGCGKAEVPAVKEPPSSARPAAEADAAQSARGFVQDFYAYYVPLLSAERVGSPWESVVRERGGAFAPELLDALQQDYAASAASADEIVGLDFDPFVASQDPCERYDLGSESVGGDTARVEVFGVCQGSRDAAPAVIAELVRVNGAWRFTNFGYPREHSDLMAVLTQLRRGRAP
jgi:hypothetical protein